MGRTVGIITYHWSENYGAVLQAYALQETVKKLGFNAEIIDYHNWYREYRGLRPVKLVRRLARRYFNRLIQNRERLRKTEEFRARYLQTTKCAYRDQDSLYSNPPTYDTYVCGSDQVWNPANNGFDQAYFLTFAPEGARKISYAASFGVSELPRRYWGDYRVWLRQLDSISVREIDGVRIVTEVAGVDAERVLDPAMLLSSDEWRRIAKNPNVPHRYILCYSVTKNVQNERWIADAAERVAQLIGSSIVSVGNRLEFTRRAKVIHMSSACPAQFLGLIDQASAVITDSFHGTAFSVIFHKPFFLAVDPQFARNSRLITLTSILGLDERRWDSSRRLTITQDMLQLDYELVDQRVAEEKNRSLHFLRRCLAE